MGVLCIYNYGGQAPATIESPISNARNRIRDFYGGQVYAIKESINSNARNRIWDFYGGEVPICATNESRISDSCDGIRDNRILATSNKRVSYSFYNCVAIIS